MKRENKSLKHNFEYFSNYCIRHLWPLGHWFHVWVQFSDLSVPDPNKFILLHWGSRKTHQDTRAKKANCSLRWPIQFSPGLLRLYPSKAKDILYLNVTQNAERKKCLKKITLEAKEVPHSKSLCSHEDQDGNERRSSSMPFPRASHPTTGQVQCQEKYQVVSRLPLIFTNQGFLDRSVSVITCVSESSEETLVLHFPFMAWPQQWQP